MLHICGVSKTFGEWYQKTNRTEDTHKLTLSAFKTIAILHNTRLATFIKLLETVSKGLFRNRSQNSCDTLLDCRRTAHHIYGAPCKARNFNVVYIRTYVWQCWNPSLSICCTMFQHWINVESNPVAQLCVNMLLATKVTLITDGI
jgi:hypothetical protein